MGVQETRAETAPAPGPDGARKVAGRPRNLGAMVLDAGDRYDAVALEFALGGRDVKMSYR